MRVEYLWIQNWLPNLEVTGADFPSVWQRPESKASDFDLLCNYMLALHSIDRDAVISPCLKRNHFAGQANLYMMRQNHPEVARTAGASGRIQP